MKTKFVSFVLGTAIGLASALVPLRAQFAYVVNALSSSVSAYSIGSNGALPHVPGSPFPAGQNPGSVAVDPTGKFAYVVNGSNNVSSFGAVSAFSIGSNGALTPVPGSPFPAGLGSESLAVDPTGKFAYVTNLSSFTSGFGAVSAFSIGSNGALTPVPGSPFATGSAPPSVAVNPPVPFAHFVTELEID